MRKYSPLMSHIPSEVAEAPARNSRASNPPRAQYWIDWPKWPNSGRDQLTDEDWGNWRKEQEKEKEEKKGDEKQTPTERKAAEKLPPSRKSSPPSGIPQVTFAAKADPTPKLAPAPANPPPKLSPSSCESKTPLLHHPWALATSRHPLRPFPRHPISAPAHLSILWKIPWRSRF